MLDFIKRYLGSPEFKKRFMAVYLPMIKQAIFYLWNKYQERKERKTYEEVYKDKVDI